MGKIIDFFKKKKLYDNTLFILFSDHGESFYEHGYKYHNFSLFDEEIKVPFILHHKSFKKSKVKTLESGNHLDIFPTIIDMFDLKSKSKLNGFSLFNQDKKRKLYMNTWTKAVNFGRLMGNEKIIYNKMTDRVSKYNLEIDPAEQNPIVVNKSEEEKLKEELINARFEIISNFKNMHIYK